jgi:sulfopyruvate decarboxylase TPP-binding subunit
VLLLLAYRGHVGDGVWWLEPLGERLERVLDAMDVRYTVVQRTEDIAAAVRDALVTMEMAKQPVAVLFRREAVRA